MENLPTAGIDLLQMDFFRPLSKGRSVRPRFPNKVGPELDKSLIETTLLRCFDHIKVEMKRLCSSSCALNATTQKGLSDSTVSRPVRGLRVALPATRCASLRDRRSGRGWPPVLENSPFTGDCMRSGKDHRIV